MKEIIVVVAADGSTTRTDVKGVKGEACDDLTKNLLNAIGIVQDSGKTSDFYLQDIGVVHDTGS